MWRCSTRCVSADLQLNLNVNLAVGENSEDSYEKAYHTFVEIEMCVSCLSNIGCELRGRGPCASVHPLYGHIEQRKTLHGTQLETRSSIKRSRMIRMARIRVV